VNPMKIKSFLSLGVLIIMFYACSKAPNQTPTQAAAHAGQQALGKYTIDPSRLPEPRHCLWQAPLTDASLLEVDQVQGDSMIHFAGTWFRRYLQDQDRSYFIQMDPAYCLSNLLYCPSDKHRSWVLITEKHLPILLSAGWTMSCDPKSDDFYLLPSNNLNSH
ncbi:MAG: hypothetical protein LPK45_09265, partial [Bacteroidota bacterium]|nr:hypothetical protein [Bacteroidota bacterium]MDX5431273.1 hypothetical protein [Bacteroidota bacterium]MDX5470012.1 hypothetical protein [Bacteroidota bacterium]